MQDMLSGIRPEKGEKCFMKKICNTESPSLAKNVVLIDGISRTGKFFLGKLVSGLENMDYFQSVILLEQVPFIYRIGGITEDAAIALLKSTLDEHAYNMRIGRNLNLRYYDASSLYNSHELDEYLRRTVNIFGEVSRTSEEIVKSFWKGGRYSSFVVHETLPNIDIFFKAYPNLKILHLVRHPIDVIHSWHARGWGKRFGTDPLAFTPTINGKNGPVPWFAFGWEEEYEKSSDIDRVIKSICALTDMSGKTYNSLVKKSRDRVLILRYERIVENTGGEISSIASFLGTKVSEGMPWILAREKCPNTISVDKRKAKEDEIRSVASKGCYQSMMKLASIYESGGNLYDKG